MRPDDDRSATAAGSVARPLLWLAVGLLVLVLASLAIAPELLEAPGYLTGGLGLAIVAGIPGALLLLAYAGRRRRLDRDEQEDQ